MAHTKHPFDYAQALESHLDWVSDLQFQVTCGTRLEPLQVLDLQGSPLGRWLQGEGLVYGGSAAFKQLAQALKELHLIASAVASFANLKSPAGDLRIYQNSPAFLHAACDVRLAMARFFKGLAQGQNLLTPQPHFFTQG